MRLKNAKNWANHSFADAIFICSGTFVLIASALFMAGPAFYGIHPYKFFFIAASIIAFVYGFKCAIAFTLVSTLFANYYFVPPFGIFTFTTAEIERYLLNVILGCTALVLIEILQRERFKSKLLLLVSESRYLILLHRDNRLLNQLKRTK